MLCFFCRRPSQALQIVLQLFSSLSKRHSSSRMPADQRCQMVYFHTKNPNLDKI
jgi:hypothetical protein